MQVVAVVIVFSASIQWILGLAFSSVYCSVISLETYILLSLLVFILFYSQC
jgi:hypothetical protein